jgi:hypothetical protein
VWRSAGNPLRRFFGDNDIEMAGGSVQNADMDSDEQSAIPPEKVNLCQYSGLTRFRFKNGKTLQNGSPKGSLAQSRRELVKDGV